MNLIVDIGNSYAKAAVFDGSRMVEHLRFREELTGKIDALLADFPIEACAYASVGIPRPDVAERLQHEVPFVLQVTGETPTPLRMGYLTPATLGADRLAASVGAASLCPGKDLLVVDAGTCVTYDYVSADARYLGGLISPGLGMRLRALHEQTARLPLVSADGEVQAVGGDTATAIRSGVMLGLEHEVRGFIRSFKNHHADGCVFITGGNGYRFAREVEAERSDALVEIGLNAILLYNR